jgi:hypothetical protein
VLHARSILRNLRKAVSRAFDLTRLDEGVDVRAHQGLEANVTPDESHDDKLLWHPTILTQPVDYDASSRTARHCRASDPTAMR